MDSVMSASGAAAAAAPPGALKEKLAKTRWCHFHLRGHCKLQADTCSFAHSAEELRSAPNLQKTKLCEAFQRGECMDGDRCKYAHRPAELRVTEDVLKTRLCRYYVNGYCRKGDACTHAHGKHQLRASKEQEAESKNRVLLDITGSAPEMAPVDFAAIENRIAMQTAMRYMQQRAALEVSMRTMYQRQLLHQVACSAAADEMCHVSTADEASSEKGSESGSSSGPPGLEQTGKDSAKDSTSTAATSPARDVTHDPTEEAPWVWPNMEMHHWQMHANPFFQAYMDAQTPCQWGASVVSSHMPMMPVFARPNM
mmetsp:Transcript_52660/g.115460  ORF Transcript_52660/g.115460 Transcript_52660/m.115460 type:complete len:311 (+) Transcript_52660:43-975(+)